MQPLDAFRSLAEFSDRLGVSHPDDVALRWSEGSISRGELSAKARSLAAGWRAAGYVAGDVVGLVGRGGPAFALAMLSANRAGLVPLLIDPRTTRDEACEIFARAKPRTLASADVPVPAYADELPVFVFNSDGCSALHTLDGVPMVEPHPHAPAMLLVTSGTTGHPRVAALSAFNLASDMQSCLQVYPALRHDVALSVLPVTHSFELTAGLLTPLFCGAAIAYPGSLNPNRLLHALEAEGITHVNMVPGLLAMLVDEVGAHSDRLALLAGLRHRLKAIVCGGAPIAPTFVEQLLGLGLPLWLGYGLTEAGPVVALGRADQLPSGSTGRPLPGIEVRIDAETKEVLIGGATVMAGYVGDAAATAATVRDGWLHTGDVGRLDADGNLFIVGRLKQLIVTAGGEKVSPEEIEAEYGSPLFAELCAVGVPDAAAGGGERPHLVVVPLTAALDESYLRQEFARLSRTAGRRRAFDMTVSREPLPRTHTLKVRRDLVRAAVLGGKRKTT